MLPSYRTVGWIIIYSCSKSLCCTVVAGRETVVNCRYTRYTRDSHQPPEFRLDVPSLDVWMLMHHIVIDCILYLVFPFPVSLASYV